jgi:NAD(P)-dependent dehydrogenase (short-subunit alcohol dehydrogenase family)
VKTIVMTGGSSGLGALAAEALARQARLRVGVRGQAPPGLQTAPLDLARLDSVRAFAASCEEPIDVLVLNAGASFSGLGYTEDGFERTFAINHLAHYLLLRLLQDKLAPAATVILTSSGTHDPAERTRLPPPTHADARLLARPEGDPDASPGRAYSASKLCNVLTARALAQRAPGLTVLAWTPGPTPGTGLVRDQGLAVSLIWKLLGTPVGRLFPRYNTPEAAGRALVELALGRIQAPPGELYAALRGEGLVWTQPSDLARRDDLALALWRDSAELVGLPS